MIKEIRWAVVKENAKAVIEGRIDDQNVAFNT